MNNDQIETGSVLLLCTVIVGGAWLFFHCLFTEVLVFKPLPTQPRSIEECHELYDKAEIRECLIETGEIYEL